MHCKIHVGLLPMLMAGKTWGYCIDCGKSLDPSHIIENEWKQCFRCGCIFKAIIAGGLLIIGFLWYQLLSKGTGNALPVLGLTFDIVGAWSLATGYLEAMLRAVRGFGGGGNAVDVISRRHFRKRVIGLVLLILGFGLQGFAYIK